MGFLHESGVKSWKELRALPHDFMACNPHCIGTESKLFEGTGS
jgi:hypothetical protein